jgi:BirA family transcriptional regulator, biotin operon repressor / biotin---[acetyl-CoA-carboxylase] ligase
VTDKPYNIALNGKVLLHYKMLESTHDHALNLLSKTRPEPGTVIMTDYQTKGRGQWTKTWVSEANKNLLCSVIQFPEFLQVHEVFKLNMVLSLSIVDLLETYKLDGVKIKWPNDILVNGAKIAGLLIGNSFSGKQIEHSVLSIGVNINQEHFTIADKQVTSMTLEREQVFVVAFILRDWLQYLDYYWSALRSGNHSEIIRKYNNRLYRLNELNAVTFVEQNERRDAIITGVEADGRLALKINNTTPLLVSYGEVKWNY